jgi:hypothetical protein
MMSKKYIKSPIETKVTNNDYELQVEETKEDITTCNQNGKTNNEDNNRAINDDNDTKTKRNKQNNDKRATFPNNEGNNKTYIDSMTQTTDMVTLQETPQQVYINKYTTEYFTKDRAIMDKMKQNTLHIEETSTVTLLEHKETHKDNRMHNKYQRKIQTNEKSKEKILDMDTLQDASQKVYINKYTTKVSNNKTLQTNKTSEDYTHHGIDIDSDSSSVIDDKNDYITNEHSSSYLYRRNVFNPPKGNKIGRKDKDTCRIIYQNINSLRPKTMDKWKATIQRTDHFEADIVGICETCINWNNNKIRQSYKNTLRKQYKINSMAVSKIPKNKEVINLPGGTATFTVNDLVHKIEAVIQDQFEMGRWTGYTY